MKPNKASKQQESNIAVEKLSFKVSKNNEMKESKKTIPVTDLSIDLKVPGMQQNNTAVDDDDEDYPQKITGPKKHKKNTKKAIARNLKGA